jgi:signal transduction histidine kinase
LKLLQSMSLRLLVTYLVLFTSSVLLIGGVHYWITVRTPLVSVEKRVNAEARALVNTYATGGASQLVARLIARTEGGTGRLPFHVFIAADGTVVTSNIPSWPPEHRDGWLRLDADSHVDGEEQDHEALLLDHEFADGARLLVGRDIEDIDEIEEKLLTAVIGVVSSSLILGILGGMFMSRAISRRINAVIRTARLVMAGDLSGRIPIRGSGDDFDELNGTLNDMLSRTEALFESVRRVSDNVAHELRTPLARLRANLEDLRKAPVPPPALIDSAIAEAEGLEKTFDAVLRIARIESGRHTGTTAPVDLSAVLADAVELYAPVAEDRQQSLRLAIADGLQVAGDRDLLFQSVCNLLDNAIKYTPQGGRILVAALRRNAHVELTVTDNGVGIPAEHRGKVSERFYRVPATAGEPGAGLGLSLVAAVADRHHSMLTFEDAAPGLTVRWLLPAP